MTVLDRFKVRKIDDVCGEYLRVPIAVADCDFHEAHYYPFAFIYDVVLFELDMSSIRGISVPVVNNQIPAMKGESK